jgi:beta-lactam-binding protein with PASTA domain
MSALTRERTARVGLAVVALAAVLMATFGVGYRTSHSLLGGSGAFVQKGHSVVHVNAESTVVDAKSAEGLATGRQRLEVVQTDSDTVWVVNNDTGAVSRLPTGSMKPARVGEKLRNPARARVVTGGGEGYVVNPDRGTLSRLDNGTDQLVAVGVPARVSEVVVDSSGAAWALSATAGELYRIAKGRVTATTRVAEPKEEAIRLALVTDRPVVYRPGAGQVAVHGTEGAAPAQVDLPRESRPVEVADGPVDTPVLVSLVPGSGKLYAVDVAAGTVRTTELRDHQGSGLGEPVVLHDRIYVPDQRLRQVVVLDLKTLHMVDLVGLPSGKERFELFVRDGRVWANDPYAPTMLVFDRTGAHTVIDKGTGDGVDGDGPRPSQPEPSEPDEPNESTRPVEPARTPEPRPSPPAEQPPPETRRQEVPALPRGMTYVEACARIRQLELACEAVPAGDDAAGLGPDEVIDTVPRAGTRVPVGSRVLVRYVGPVTVPPVVGQSRGEACAAIEASGLTCRTTIDSDPADRPEQLLRVEAQDPQPRTDVDRGETVTITYRNAIALPRWAGSTWRSACAEAEDSYHLRCEAQQGSPTAGQCTKPGIVYDQSPRPGRVATTGSRLTLVVCPGSMPVGDYRNLQHNPNDASQQTACAQIVRHGFTCNAVAGDSAVGTGAQPFTTYQQTPAPGAPAPAGSTVTVTYYSNNGQPIGSYAGASYDAACADVQAKGYQCSAVRQLHPDAAVATNVVFGQDQVPGAYPLGSTITIRYQELQPVEFWIYRHDTADAYVMAPVNQRPPNWGRAAYRVGLGYPAGANLSTGSVHIKELRCTNQTPGDCNGVTPNVFYSHLTSYKSWAMSSVATFMHCTGAPGQRPMYRIWRGPVENRHYGINQDPNSAEFGAEDHEELGCVW